MCSASFCPCISLSRTTPVGRSRCQTSGSCMHSSSAPNSLPTLTQATLFYSGSERGGSTQPYNSDPFRSHPAPIAPPQELHRCDRKSPDSPHKGRRAHDSTNVSPSRKTWTVLSQLFRSKGDVRASPPTFRNSRQSVSPDFIHARKTCSRLLQRSSFIFNTA